MTIPDLLDGGFEILRRAPRTVLAVTAVFVVPTQLLSAYVQRSSLEDLRDLFENPTLASQQGGGIDGGQVLALVLSSLAVAFVGAALAVVVTAWYGGAAPTAGEALGVVARRSPSLVVAWLLVHLLEGAGLFVFGVATLVVMTFYLVTAPVIAVERTGPFRAMARAGRLGGRRFWPLLGIAVTTGIVGVALGFVLSTPTQLLAYVIGPDLGWIVLGVGSIAADLLTTSVIAGATVLAYLDVRVRTEGLDLAFAADRHLPL